MMGEWITDRLPELEEATNEGDVWVYDVEADEYYIRNYKEITKGQPWMEIPPPPSYVKPERWGVLYSSAEGHCVFDMIYGGKFAYGLPTREAANEIAAVYKRVMP